MAAQMEATLRPFDPETDFPALSEIWTANYPFNPRTPDRMRFFWESVDPARFYRERTVALDQATDRLVGTASFNHSPEMFHSDKYQCGVAVHPDYQRRGIGGRLWEWLSGRLRERQAVLARSSVWEGHPHAVAFAEKRDFREKRRVWQSLLDVEAVNLDGLAHRGERMRSQGITSTTLAVALEQDPQSLQKLYALFNEAMRHTPLPDVPTDVPYDMFERWMMQEPGRLPDACFIARDGDHYVGVSFLSKGTEEATLIQNLTATDPEYMARGIAWGLKVQTVQYARHHGYRYIKTWNDSENQPMLSINLRLGFKPLPAWITIEREFTR